MIPDRLQDNSTRKKNHNEYAHLLFCIIPRVSLGSYLLLKESNKKDELTDDENTYSKNYLTYFILFLSFMIIILFSNKYYTKKINNEDVWKVYMRSVISYFVIILLSFNSTLNKSNTTLNNKFIGSLMINDALMGYQSRYITSNFNS